MYKNATKCNETIGKWCKNKHGASKIIDTFETYHSSTPVVEPPWYLDTATTDHLTGDLDRLHMREPYHGHDHIHTANGSGMRISNTGQSYIPTNTPTPLYLKNVLHVPDVTSSLLSVKKLTRDNNVFVEFHPDDVL
jgi:hypothetical protein